MLKFTIDAKELKMMINKGITVINKKANISSFTKLYFQAELDNTLKVFGISDEHYVEVRSSNIWNTNPGILGINIEDLKVITKMTGEITLEDISTQIQNKINIICGKKHVTIPGYKNTDTTPLFDMDDTEECILSVRESWLLETVTNLSAYTGCDSNNKMMQVFNFNTTHRRVEALEGHIIGIRSLENQNIKKENDSLLLHNICVPVFKKVLNKKSSTEVQLLQNKKYIKVNGSNFTYIIKKVDGSYFNIEKMFTDDFNYSFIVDRNDILSVMKYDCDLIKNIKKPIILHSENGILYTYLKTEQYEVSDVIKTMDNKMDNNLYIGFNPFYLVNAFNIVDTDKPFCCGKNSLSPLFIKGNEYKFLILPVNIKDSISKIKKVY